MDNHQNLIRTFLIIEAMDIHDVETEGNQRPKFWTIT